MPAYGNVCLRVVFVVVAVVIVVAVVTVVVGIMFALPRETFFRHLAAIFTKKNLFNAFFRFPLRWSCFDF